MKRKTLLLTIALLCMTTAFSQGIPIPDSNLTWQLSGIPWNYTLTISGNDTMPDYSLQNYPPWYDYRKQIKTLVIEDGVTKIGDLAFNDHNISGILTIPTSVISIGFGSFQGCNLRGTLTIPASITSIGISAFRNCGQIDTLFFNAKCSDYHGFLWFSQNKSLSTLIIGDNVERIPKNAFYNCEQLKGSLIIPNSVTSIGNGAFSDCSSFDGSLTIGNSVTSIGDFAFSHCSKLKTLNFNATNCSDVSSSTWLRDTPLLTSLIIGSNVQRIPAYAFSGCSSIKSISALPTTPPLIENNTFYGILTSIPVFVPCASLEDYQTASYWNDFTNYQTPSIPVKKIINVPTNATINVPLKLTGTVFPENATNKTIEWSLVYAGATNAKVISGVLYTSAEGVAVVRATVKKGSCDDIDYTQDSDIKVGTVGIDDNLPSYISLHPNPTTGELRMENEEWRITNVEILDIFGRKVLEPSLSILQSYDLTVLHPGVYFVKITTEAGEVVKKILKE